ncbi:hypothetical protein [Rhodopseudomonas palustris]|uniref:Uncharacterized protein n=2 Tax=Rhodopseudomonas TaxID=1073 RepID=A0A0D7F484_RHOPL|nr:MULTISPECIES: hypothetical protein [Rhodopseudomonas]KIZ47611.1 hypothetical protein OO17_03420 [Rhodopseudomonas palustris]MDF3808967.1 hypothetical protein [Rhodopseudomonas sp. BAL398]
MPYALFCDDAKVSKTYPTKDNVWEHAKESGLVIDIAPTDDKPTSSQALDNGYEIRACRPDPGENPEKNERDAHAQRDFQVPASS